MFAVIKTGGKQYKVAKDDIVTVEKLAAEAGETVQFNEILMVGGEELSLGSPLVAGAAVQAEVLEQFRGPKTISFKKRRRKHSSQRRKGHRQYLTRVKVLDILASGGDKSGVKAALGAGSAPAAVAQAPAKKTAEKTTKKTAKKTAAKKTAAKKPAPKKAAAKPAKEPAPKAATAPAESTAPKNLLKAPKGEADDLKKIAGVGPKLEQVLNENGVFHFWQIAEWTGDDVAYMDEKLSFKGRIGRDDWVAKAAELAEAEK
ncbi:MAG: 50S ribosomal protein L21 [Paracoccaceae bacterium]